MNIGEIIGAITGLGSLFGTTSASGAASSAASAQKEALAQQREWLDKIWKYYEPELQRRQQMQTMLDPYRNQASAWLASMTGMKTAPYYGGQQPPAQGATPAPGGGGAMPPPAASGTRPIIPWTGGLPGQSNSPYGGQPVQLPVPTHGPWGNILEEFKKRALAAAPTTGPAAGMGAAPSTRLPWQQPRIPAQQPADVTLPWRPPAAPNLGAPNPVTLMGLPGQSNAPPAGRPTRPGNAIKLPVGAGWGATPTVPTPGVTTPGVPAPAAPGALTAPPVTAPIPGVTPAPSSGVAPTLPAPVVAPVPGAAAPAPGTPETPPWFLQVPELTPALQGALTGTPDWQNPFTPQQAGALTNLSDVNISDQYNQRNQAMQQMLARRGLSPVGGTSSMDTSTQVGLQNWLQNQQANQQSQMALAGMQRGDQLRSENLAGLLTQNQLEGGRRGEGRLDYNTLLNFLTGQAAAQPEASSLYGGVSGYGNVAGGYGDLANMYGGMASSSAGNLGNLLAQLFGSQGGGTNYSGFTPVGSPVGWSPAP